MPGRGAQRSGLTLLAAVLAAAVAVGQPLAAGQPAAAGSAAQPSEEPTGTIQGRVVDAAGKPIPGVEVTLVGIDPVGTAGSGGAEGTAPEPATVGTEVVHTTDENGGFRFSGLAEGNLKIRAVMEGYSTIEYLGLKVQAGHTTTVEITLEAPFFSEPVVSNWETVLLDPQELRSATAFYAPELRQILTLGGGAWRIVATAPGALGDHPGASAGADGRQPFFAGPGATGANTAWTIDGMAVTDMASLGASPAVYDADTLYQVEVYTGGSEAESATGGVIVNLVPQSGAADWRGGARFLDAPSGAAARSGTSRGQLGAGQPPGQPGGSVTAARDQGAELAGPLVRDHFWAWVAYGGEVVRTAATSLDAPGAPGAHTQSTLPTWTGKLLATPTPNLSLNFFVLQSAAKVEGLDAGLLRPQPTTWDQRPPPGDGGSPTVAKAEATRLFNPQLYATAAFSAVRGGFSLLPEGGGGSIPYLDPGLVWHDTFASETAAREQRQGKLDVAWFVTEAPVEHFIKAGAGYRAVDSGTADSWGDGLIVADGGFAGPPGFPGSPGFPGAPGGNLFEASRGSDSRVRTTYTSAYAEDVVEFQRLTANLGLRYDLQRGHDLPSSVAADPAFPLLLPGFRFGGSPSGFDWSNLSPRAGLAFAMTSDRATLARLGYSRFADQLGTAYAGILDPAAHLSYLAFGTPETGPGLPAVLLPLPGQSSPYSGNVNPATGLPLAWNAVAHGFAAPLTDEVRASLERELSFEMLAGLALTWRHLSNLVAADAGPVATPGGGPAAGGIPLVFDDPNPFDPATLGSAGRPATPADYVPRSIAVTLPDGRTANVTYYVLKPGISTRGGVFLTNSGGTSDYRGASLYFHTRPAGRFMLRANFTWSDWRYGSSGMSGNIGARADPTDLLPDGSGPSGRGGDVVLVGGGGPAGPGGPSPPNLLFVNARWSGNLNAMVQVAPNRGWGFNLLGNLQGRQGYPVPYYVRIPLDLPNYPVGLGEDVLVGRADAVRLPAVLDLDARIEKPFVRDPFTLTLSLDCFNLWNAGTVTSRVPQLGLPSSGFAYEVLSPRIVRFGLRLEVQ